MNLRNHKPSLTLVAILAACAAAPLQAQMAQDPLLSRTAAVEPNIVFMFDDSASMPATAVYQFGGSPGVYGMSGPGDDVSASAPTTFHGRSPDVNLIYYDPRVTYVRRINADGSAQAAGATGSISSFNVYFHKPAASNTYGVSGVSVSAKGSGYPGSGVTASFPAPPAGGVQAAATVQVVASQTVQSVTVTNKGLGYPSAGVVASFTTPAGGVQATGNVVIGATKKVDTVNVTTPGCYPVGVTFTFSAPPSGGTQATGTVQLRNNNSGCTAPARRINTITVVNGGIGYTTAPTLTFSGGSGGAFTVNLGNTNWITGINITNPGSGYSSTPVISLSGTGTGTGAAFTVNTGTTNVISGINITNAGSGYTTQPTLSLQGTSGGSGATFGYTYSSVPVPSVNAKWNGAGTPTTAVSYFSPTYTIDAGSPLAVGAPSYPYPNTATSATTNYPKFRNRTDCDATACTWTQERQNYANWKTYHSTRLELAKTGIGLAFQPLNPTFRLGWGLINTLDNGNLDKGVRLYNSTVQSEFMTWLYARTGTVTGTPNRAALTNVGKYYQRVDDAGPWGTSPAGDAAIASGGAENVNHASCRRSYAMLMTDGYYNEGSFTLTDADTTAAIATNSPSTYQYTPVGPYSDTINGTKINNTFADVAMKYWLTDLRPNLANGVKPVTGDEAYWQHLNFYAIGLGLVGTLDATNPQTLASLTGTSGSTPPRTLNWPSPAGNDPKSIDDMWHATINGRGKMLNAKTADELNTAIVQMMSDIGGKEATQAGVAVSTASLTQGTKKYTPSYTSVSWNGNVTAYNLDATNGNQTGVAWQVETLVSTDPVTGAKTYSSLIPDAATRKIYVGNGATSGTPRAIDFKHPSLTPTMITAMGGAGVVNAALIDYLRGDPSKEHTSVSESDPLAIYRARATRLGDIVNSTPAFVKSSIDLNYEQLPTGFTGRDTYRAYVDGSGSPAAGGKKQRSEGVLFVGANDGMLHGFRDGTFDTLGNVVNPGGVEVFAYVPNALLPSLKDLADETYGTTARPHRYYVDGPNIETDAYVGGGWKNIVLGTTGAGAGTLSSAGVSPRSGVFAINTTGLNTSATALDASSVMWEVNSSQTDFTELGFVLTDVQAGPSLNTTHPWIAVFGNGYESKSCKAMLYVVNLETGARVREIDTGVGSCGAGAKNGLGGVRVVRNANQQIIGAYAGDQQGNVWKFNLNNADFNSWGVDLGGTPLLKTAATKPITAPPAVLPLSAATGPIGPTSGYMVIAGTGKFFEVSDITNTAQQTFYSVWDPLAFGAGPPPPGTTLNMAVPADKAKLVQQTIGTSTVAINGNTYASLSTFPVDYSGATPKRGCYIDFIQTGQRLVYPIDLLAKRFAVADTISPSNVSLDVCVNETGGTSFLYLVDALTCGGPSEAILDTNGDGNIDSNDLVVSGVEGRADGRNVSLQISGDKFANVSSAPGSTIIEFNCRVLGNCASGGPARIKSREWRQLFMR